jgi:hypothetical protein
VLPFLPLCFSSCQKDFQIRRNIRNGQIIAELGKQVHSSIIRAVAFSRDGLRLLSASDDGEMRL